MVSYIHSSDALEFSNTNLELYRPVVVGETVKIDCATDQKNVSLDLLQLKKGADKPVVLKVNFAVVKLSNE